MSGPDYDDTLDNDPRARCLEDLANAWEDFRQACKEHRKFDWNGFNEGYVRYCDPPSRREEAQAFVTALKKALEFA